MSRDTVPAEEEIKVGILRLFILGILANAETVNVWLPQQA